MNVVSIDFDIIMAPSIELYNNANGNREQLFLNPTMKTCEADLAIYNKISFWLYNQVKYLSDCGLNESSIASNLRANPYRVRKSMQVAYKISQTKINNVLDKIYQLDYTIKSGQIDRFVGFELFLINFNN